MKLGLWLQVLNIPRQGRLQPPEGGEGKSEIYKYKKATCSVSGVLRSADLPTRQSWSDTFCCRAGRTWLHPEWHPQVRSEQSRDGKWQNCGGGGEWEEEEGDFGNASLAPNAWWRFSAAAPSGHLMYMTYALARHLWLAAGVSRHTSHCRALVACQTAASGRTKK